MMLLDGILSMDAVKAIDENFPWKKFDILANVDGGFSVSNVFLLPITEDATSIFEKVIKSGIEIVVNDLGSENIIHSKSGLYKGRWGDTIKATYIVFRHKNGKEVRLKAGYSTHYFRFSLDYPRMFLPLV